MTPSTSWKSSIIPSNIICRGSPWVFRGQISLTLLLSALLACFKIRLTFLPIMWHVILLSMQSFQSNQTLSENFLSWNSRFRPSNFVVAFKGDADLEGGRNKNFFHPRFRKSRKVSLLKVFLEKAALSLSKFEISAPPSYKFAELKMITSDCCLQKRHDHLNQEGPIWEKFNLEPRVWRLLC